jgi:V8-like Glu-specific endopeptidase
MRRAVLLLTLMALTILAASGVAGAIINGRPDGSRHSYVGMVYNDGALCSGTLISPTAFLTAGHCTTSLSEGGSQVYVTFESQADSDPQGAYRGTPLTHPSYPAVDVGVVVLERPVTNVGYGRLPAAGLVNTLGVGQPLTAVGYGGRKVFPAGLLRPEASRIRYVGTVEFLGIYQGNYIRVSGGGLRSNKTGICFGDSGGPLFPSDQTTVVGVVSRGSPVVCAGQSSAQRIDLPQVLSWVNGFL